MEFYAGRPLVGYRSWIIREGDHDLRSSVMDTHHWPQGVHEAECIPSAFRHKNDNLSEDHESPNDLCTCGIYARYEIHPLNIEKFRELSMTYDQLSVVGVIFGSIIAWGRIHLHEKGFKAQFAKPVAIIDHIPSAVGSERRRKLKAVARRYDIKIVSASELGEYSRTHGLEYKDYL